MDITHSWESPNFKEATGTYNEKWHDYNQTDAYKTTIEKCEVIKIVTSKGNIYEYRRPACTVLNCKRGTMCGDCIHDFVKYTNGELPTNPPVVKIIGLTGIIQGFYGNKHPVTQEPLELPTNISIY